MSLAKPGRQLLQVKCLNKSIENKGLESRQDSRLAPLAALEKRERICRSWVFVWAQ